MRYKRELSKFIAEKISDRLNLEEIPYDYVLELLVEFEESKEAENG